MSAYTTLTIERSQAKSMIIDKVMNGLSDKDLERLLDYILEDSLYNAMIVPDGWSDES